MKPFIKPQPPAPATPAAPVGLPPLGKVSPNELTILAVACAIADPLERDAYLERVCGEDTDLRDRVEKRLAEREPPAPVVVPAAVPQAELMPQHSHNHGSGAVAIVPMGNMQLTPAGSMEPRQSPFPWALAVLLAMAVGALAVFLTAEKSARTTAENQAKAALGARDLAQSERASAVAGTSEARAQADRAEEKRQEAEKLRAVSDSRRTIAEAETKSAIEEAKAMKTAADAAKAELAKSRQQLAAVTESQKAARSELAGTLGRFALMLVDSGKHGEAEVPARQALELRASLDPASWATQEAHYTLGAALMGKGDMPAAEKELLAALAGMEPFLQRIEEFQPQVKENVRTRYVTAVKKLSQLYRSTGQKREATEILKKLAPPPTAAATSPAPQ